MDKQAVTHPMQYFNTVGEEIEDILTSNGLAIDNFLFEMGWVSSDLKAVLKVTKLQAQKIEQILQIEDLAAYLLNFSNNYRISDREATETFKKHQKIFRKIQHLHPLLRGEFNDGIDILEDISEFLQIENEEEILDRVHENIALYRISTFTPDSLNLYAWLKRGELDFSRMELPIYDKKSFLSWLENEQWKANLQNMAYIFSLPEKMREFGIGLVYTPHLEKTVFGAVRWFNGRPLVQVSDKGKCIATFWYTLFHEFGHVILHENDEIFEGTLDLPKNKITKKEQEANSFAFERLFNGDNLRRYIFGYKGQYVDDTFIDNISRKFGVDKMFTAFWMKKAQVKSKTIQANTIKLEFD